MTTVIPLAADSHTYDISIPTVPVADPNVFYFIHTERNDAKVIRCAMNTLLGERLGVYAHLLPGVYWYPIRAQAARTLRNCKEQTVGFVDGNGNDIATGSIIRKRDPTTGRVVSVDFSMSDVSSPQDDAESWWKRHNNGRDCSVFDTKEDAESFVRTAEAASSDSDTDTSG